MIPQLILIALWIVSLTINAVKHGEIKKESKYDFWVSLTTILIIATFLYFLGFFDGFKNL